MKDKAITIFGIVIILAGALATKILASSNPSEVSFEQIRKWLELLSFCATILTTGVAWYALRQIRLMRAQTLLAADAIEVAKRDIAIRSKREAALLAAQKCEELADTKIQKQSVILEKLKKNQVPLQVWELRDFEFTPGSLVDRTRADQWVQDLRGKGLHNDVVEFINYLEGFAIYFSSGAADEEVAFPVMGIPFTTAVGVFAPYIIAMRHQHLFNSNSGKFFHTEKLYTVWRQKLQKEDLEAQLKSVQQSLSNMKPQQMKPHGT